MNEIEVKVKLPSSPELCAAMFCEMDAGEQTQVLALIRQKMKDWGACERYMQMYYIAEEVKKSDDAKKFIEELKDEMDYEEEQPSVTLDLTKPRKQFEEFVELCLTTYFPTDDEQTREARRAVLLVSEQIWTESGATAGDPEQLWCRVSVRGGLHSSQDELARYQGVPIGITTHLVSDGAETMHTILMASAAHCAGRFDNCQNFGGDGCLPDVLKRDEDKIRKALKLPEKDCDECYGTGLYHGIGRPCSKGCKS